MTNAEIIAVNQKAEKSRQLYRDNNKVVWCSNIPGSKNMYFALFNLDEVPVEIPVTFSQMGLNGICTVRDLWLQKDMGSFSDKFSDIVEPHGAKIFKISSN